MSSSGSLQLRRPARREWQYHQVIRSDGFVHFGSCLVRKSWLDRLNGFDDRHRLIEDVDLQIRILAAGGRFQEAASEEPLFFYNQRADSLSRTNAAEFVEGIIRNAKLVQRIAEQRDQFTGEVVESVCDVYRTAIDIFAEVDRGRFEAVYREFATKFPNATLRARGNIALLPWLLSERRAVLVAGGTRRIKKALCRMANRHAFRFRGK